MSGRLTYRSYERRRLGDRRGLAAVVRMSRRAFTAPSFGAFWRIWNPLFAYYLYRWCYAPFARSLPRSSAVILTFAVSGAIHDVFASLAVRGPYLLFTPVFAVFGGFVVIEERAGWSLRRWPRPLRVVFHGAVIAGCIAAGLALRAALLAS